MPTRLNTANFANTTLLNGIGASDTSLTVANANGFPLPPFRITIDSEIIEVGAVSGNVFSLLIRGVENTTAANHVASTSVQNRWTAGTYSELVSLTVGPTAPSNPASSGPFWLNTSVNPPQLYQYVNTAYSPVGPSFGANTYTAMQTAPAFTVTGMTGATYQSRHVGGTSNAAPASGTFQAGDYVIDQTGSVWICSVAGSPGTWIKAKPTVQYIPLWNSDANYVQYSGTVAGQEFMAMGNTGAQPESVVGTRLHTLDPWPSNTQFALEVGMCSSSGASYPARAALWDMTTNSIVNNSTIQQNNTQFTLTRSGTFTLVSGHSYGVTLWNSGAWTYINRANLVVFP